jgi:hypothetical protein
MDPTGEAGHLGTFDSIVGSDLVQPGIGVVFPIVIRYDSRIGTIRLLLESNIVGGTPHMFSSDDDLSGLFPSIVPITI